MRALSIWLALLFAIGCGSEHRSEEIAPAAASASPVEVRLTHGGLDRRYLVAVPADTKAPLPVVVVLHGGGGNAEQASDSLGLDSLRAEHGALLVYPEGVAQTRLKRSLATWNAGACCGKAAADNVDDVGFIAAVLDDLEKRYNVDSSRVFVTGHSNGAMLSYRLACELSERIAAIAPVGAQSIAGACKPTRHVPTLHIHGQADRCARYEGGTCGGCFAEMLGREADTADTWACGAVPDTISQWAGVQGCTGELGAPTTDAGASCRSVAGCPSDGRVTLCTLPNGGHAFPGAKPSAFCQRAPKGALCERWKGLTGPAVPDFPTAEVLWRFFSEAR